MGRVDVRACVTSKPDRAEIIAYRFHSGLFAMTVNVERARARCLQAARNRVREPFTAGRSE